jgi:hypothetical protein
MKHIDRVGLHRANASTRRKIAGFRFIEVVDSRADAFATAHVDAAPVLNAIRGFVVLPVQVVLGILDVNERLYVNIYADSGERSFEFADRGGRTKLGLDDARAALDLDEDNKGGHTNLLL